ncbi:MAG: hypothetical protein ACPLRA_00530 [Candidatus Saccharicenans sp.]
MKNLKDNKVLRIMVLFGLLISLACYASSSWYKIDRSAQPTFKEEIIISPEETEKNILAFGSRVVVEGKVRESVVVFGGEIVVSGQVGKSVVGFGSKVLIKSSAEIGEDLVVVGGTMEKEPGCRVEQDTVFIPTGGKLLGEIFRKGIFFPLGTLFLALKLISLFFGILLTMFVAGMFPRQVAFASDKIRQSFWPVMGTGLLTIVVYLGLIILSIGLIFLIIGIPLFFLLLLAGMILKIFGGTVVAYLFGESFLRAVGLKKMPQVIWTAVIGLLIVFILTMVPVLGLIFSLFMALIGWGAAIQTRFGTLNNWFSKNRI